MAKVITIHIERDTYVVRAYNGENQFLGEFRTHDLASARNVAKCRAADFNAKLEDRTEKPAASDYMERIWLLIDNNPAVLAIVMRRVRQSLHFKAERVAGLHLRDLLLFQSTRYHFRGPERSAFERHMAGLLGCGAYTDHDLWAACWRHYKAKHEDGVRMDSYL